MYPLVDRMERAAFVRRHLEGAEAVDEVADPGEVATVADPGEVATVADPGEVAKSLIRAK